MLSKGKIYYIIGSFVLILFNVILQLLSYDLSKPLLTVLGILILLLGIQNNALTNGPQTRANYYFDKALKIEKEGERLMPLKRFVALSLPLITCLIINYFIFESPFLGRIL